MTVKNSQFNHTRSIYPFQARNFNLSLGHNTKVMGIVNVTPDSFSGDGLLKSKSAFQLALQHIADGADIIDVGGESSRPGAVTVNAQEEIQRIIPVIIKLTKVVKVPISVDTYKGLTAQYALDAGASIINNIQGIKPQRRLLKMVARYNAGIILMHMRGTPRNMQKMTHYNNLIIDMINDFKIALENCLESGIKSDNIVLDPGIGFAKTAEQNLAIINRLAEFKTLKKPILIGTSRKSFISKILNTTSQNRMAGTIASGVLSIANGAHLLRVHDVASIVQAVRISDAIINQNKTKPALS